MRLSTKQKILIAKAANRGVALVRNALGRGMRDRFERQGLRWELDLDEGIDFSIYLLGAFEPDLVRFYRSRIAAGNVVIDIGANIGAHTLHFARLVGAEGKVLAIEPTTFALEKLRRNISLNPDVGGSIEILQLFLTAAPTEPIPDLSSSWPLVGATDDPILVGAKLHSTEGARAVTLDGLVSEKNLQRVDWIKLDVDGHELEVLKGGLGVLRRHRPAILMELSPYCHPGTGFEEMVATLLEAGYGFQQIPGGRRLPSQASVLRTIIPEEGGINVLAAPVTP